MAMRKSTVYRIPTLTVALRAKFGSDFNDTSIDSVAQLHPSRDKVDLLRTIASTDSVAQLHLARDEVNFLRTIADCSI